MFSTETLCTVKPHEKTSKELLWVLGNPEDRGSTSPYCIEAGTAAWEEEDAPEKLQQKNDTATSSWSWGGLKSNPFIEPTM